MSIYDVELETLAGEPSTLLEHKGRALLVVNVASECGKTPQYAGLQRLHEELGPRGLAVLGFPCNQFGEQEPGTPEQIRAFCDSAYGVTFPLYAKVEVNGPGRHPLYAILTAYPEQSDVRWNFEKFLVSPEGDVVGRFDPRVEPDDPALRTAIEAVLPG